MIPAFPTLLIQGDLSVYQNIGSAIYRFLGVRPGDFNKDFGGDFDVARDALANVVAHGSASGSYAYVVSAIARAVYSAIGSGSYSYTATGVANIRTADAVEATYTYAASATAMLRHYGVASVSYSYTADAMVAGDFSDDFNPDF